MSGTRALTLRNRKRAVYKNRFVQMLISIPESINFGTIFIFHHSARFLYLLFGTALRYVLFPFAAIASIATAALSWHLYLNDYDDNTGKRKTFNAIKAVWDTLQAGGVTGAVITGIVGAALGVAVGFGIAVTFTVLLGASTIFQACVTGYSVYKASQCYKAYLADKDDKNLKAAYDQSIEIIKINVFWTMTLGLLCTGIALAMVAGFPLTGAIIGAVTCAAAATYTALSLYQHYQQRRKMNMPGAGSSESLLALDDLRSSDSTSLMMKEMPRHRGKVNNSNTANNADVNTSPSTGVDQSNAFDDLDAHRSMDERRFVARREHGF